MMQKIWNRKNKKGFTLVELMIVVAIIAILIAIAVPIYSTVTANAEKTACQANQRSIESAGMTYYADKGSYAADLDTLKSDGFVPDDIACKSGGTLTYDGSTTGTKQASCDQPDHPLHTTTTP